MNAEQIAKSLGGHKVGRAWIAPCPAHDDSNPSLSIRQDGVTTLIHCFAGCDPRDVIAVLRERGHWTRHGQRSLSRLAHRLPAEHSPDQDAARRGEAALALWHFTKSARGTQVETYLASRGIDLPVPDALRYDPALKHPSGGIWPVMVALVTNGADGTPLAVHRTFLARDSSGKAPVDPQKMMLGPCRGGTVRLAAPGDVLMVGEGVETCLAAMQATGYPAWASLSTGGMRTLHFPQEVRNVIVLADGDDPGEAAAQDCARRWKREGRRVRIARAPRGKDFNDLLLRRPRFEEVAG